MIEPDEMDGFEPADAVKGAGTLVLLGAAIVAGSYGLAAWAIAGWPSIWAAFGEAFPCVR